MIAERKMAGRDPRLDFFRGLAMFIIVISHTPRNPWTLWIPARFGFSDATEIFVFCSGMASAIAFGATFMKYGWWMGAARTAFRVWQVYWAHICTFLLIAGLMVGLNHLEIGDNDYVGKLNLWPFFERTEMNLPALMTLTYVPNYFDILPMYLVILAMMPFMILLARVSVGLVYLASFTIWLAANFGLLSLPAEPWSDRQWFFNPFAWQLLFFIGFGFMAGWIPAPPVRRDFVVATAIFVIVTIPIAWFRIRNGVPVLQETHAAIFELRTKTQFGILRLLHFLALAYLAWVAVGPMGHRLSVGTWWPRLVSVIRKVGQQSLAVFVSGLVLSRLLGVAMDILGRDMLSVAVVNITGMGIVVAIAYIAAWFKSAPWKGKPRSPAPEAPKADGVFDARRPA